MTTTSIRTTLLVSGLAGAMAAGAAGPGGGNLAEHAAAQYRDQARYPAWSQPVPKGQFDPVAAERTPTRQSLPGPNGAGPRLEVWSDALRFEQGDEVGLRARLIPAGSGKRDADLPLSPKAGNDGQASNARNWQISAELVSRELGTVGEVDYSANGAVYNASFTLPASLEPPVGQARNIAVKVTATADDGTERKAVGGFLYSNPAAELTGEFRERVVDGNLVLATQVDVEAQARFHLAGTLATADGEPLATAQLSRELEPGTHWLDLTYYGLILSERGASGPFRLSSVTLSTTEGMPNALGPVLNNAYMTKAFAAAQFHERPFGRKDLIKAAEHLEAEAARSN